MKKLLLAVLLLVAAGIVTSCAADQVLPPSTDRESDLQTVTRTETDSDTSAGIDRDDYLILAEGGKTDYRLIYSADATTTQKTVVKSWVSDFGKDTGAPLVWGTDKKTAPGAREIVFAASLQRDFVNAPMEACPLTGYSVSVAGERIILCAYSNELYEKAASRLLGQVEQLGDGVFGIRKDISLVWQDVKDTDLPKLSSAAGTLLGGRVYYQGNGNYVVGYENVTAAEAEAYLTRLAALGYEKKAENRLGAVSFATYQKASATVYTNWNAAEKCFRMTVGNDAYLPPASSGSYTARKAPTLAQPARNGAKQTAPGMSYVLQLADGRYILVDGGGSDADDEAALLRYLTENKPDTHEKPVIALWMITHAHGDHIGLATDFLNRHGSEVRLEAVAHNFPDFNYNPASREDMTNALANRFLAAARAASPTLKRWILHSGQTAMIAGAKIEILYTPEDYFPNSIDWGNDTCCAWKITVGGKTVLFTADCDPILCDDMAKWYGSEVLQCDVLQVTHHGFNGATMAFYKAIDPKICLWSCDETRFLNDGRCLGTLSGYEFNRFLRREKWTRGGATGEREHYHAGQTYIYRFT